MADIPYLNDTNFNFITAKNFSIETVSLLPIGYGVAEKGAIVNYKDKLHIWDGSAWQTWKDVGFKWTDEVNESLTTPRPENYVWNLASTYLGTLDRSASYSIGYTDDIARTLGTLHYLGKSSAIDWSLNNGRFFSVTARDGSYFNIYNDSGEPPPDSNHKAIITNTDTNIMRVKKALFTYRDELGSWLLISYETVEDWMKIYNIQPTPFFSETSRDFRFPTLIGNGFPYDGFYEVHAFVVVKELEWDFITPVNCQMPQELLIKAPNGVGWLNIDISPVFVATMIADGSKLINNSLQGSIYIYVEAPTCGERFVELRVSLPNGAQHKIEGGYVNFKYLGKLEGQVCSDT